MGAASLRSVALSGTFARIDCSLTNVLSTLSRDRIRRAIGRFKRSLKSKKQARNPHPMLELSYLPHSSRFIQMQETLDKTSTSPQASLGFSASRSQASQKLAVGISRQFLASLSKELQGCPHCTTLQTPQTFSGIRTLPPLCR